ncbi:flagellar protein FlgN [Marinobacteraceae bacterium S3BR75-40.1]
MTDFANTLTTLLKEDLGELQSLETAIADERSAIQVNDLDKLAQSTELKNQLLDRLRERAKKKVHVLVKMGYRPDQGKPSEFLRRAALEPELQNLWQKAQDQLKHCQERNAVNGQVLNHLLNRVSRLSDIVRGVQDKQKLYGDSGREQAVNHKSILASA